MKTPIFALLLFILCASSLKAQLKEFEISEMPRPEVPIVQANTDFPEDALIIVYSSFDNLSFRSSMGMIDKQSFNPQSNRFEIFVKPFKQNIFVFSSDFMEGRISTINPNAKDVFYFKVEEKKTALLNQTVPGKLTINSIPSGANISLNGISITNKTPFTGEINPGQTRIQLSKIKYQNLDTIIIVQSAINEVLTINLKPTTLWLNIKTNPSSALVELDGQIIGKTPLSIEQDLIDKNKLGERILTFYLSDYATLNQTIQLYPSLNPLEINVDLIKLEGILKNDKDAKGAESKAKREAYKKARDYAMAEAKKEKASRYAAEEMARKGANEASERAAAEKARLETDAKMKALAEELAHRDAAAKILAEKSLKEAEEAAKPVDQRVRERIEKMLKEGLKEEYVLLRPYQAALEGYVTKYYGYINFGDGNENLTKEEFLEYSKYFKIAKMM